MIGRRFRVAWWRLPLVHFLVLGGLLHVAVRLVPFRPESGGADEPEAVVIAASQILEVRAAWKRERGQWPDPAEEKALVDQLIADELLVREARRQGLDRDDLIVRRRLIDKMTFLSDDPAASRADLYHQAVEIGLDRDDPIVRRRLIQKMHLLAGAEAGPVRATEQELREYYDSHAQHFVEPARLRLSHVFLSRDRRQASVGAEARELLRELQAKTLAPEHAVALGDPFLLGHHLPPHTETYLERNFGQGFAAAVMDLPSGVWAGPVESAYGHHLVWIHGAVTPRRTELAAVRRKVLEGIRTERQARRMATFLETLRQRYPVRIEELS